jgi:hypothetical protein
VFLDNFYDLLEFDNVAQYIQIFFMNYVKNALLTIDFQFKLLIVYALYQS